jgi:hypothetical protein
MTRGICYIAFGEEYDKLAAHTVAYSARFVSCGITVISNLKNRCSAWEDVPHVNFIYLDMPTDENRRAKIELYKYTPYDETIYLDVDAVVQRTGIEAAFSGLSDSDIVFQHHSLWSEGKKYYRIYRETARKFGLGLPLRVRLGGFWAFRKSQETIMFFEQWLDNWIATGFGRDMPAMCCAIKQTGIRHWLLYKKVDKLFSFGDCPDCVVVHRVGRDDLNRFGIEAHKQNKPFDAGRRENWDMVYFNESDDLIENDPWIKKKFDRVKRISENNKYISDYLPEIQRGGLRVLDIATGPGEFMELATAAGCSCLGVEITAPAAGNHNADKYLRFSRLKHLEKNLNVLYADINEIMLTGDETIDSQKWDVINCKHAINFFSAGGFDFKMVDGTYKNTGSWVFGSDLDAWFKRFLSWSLGHLSPGGILMIGALLSENLSTFSVWFQHLAKSSGFTVEKVGRDLNFKLRASK